MLRKGSHTLSRAAALLVVCCCVVFHTQTAAAQTATQTLRIVFAAPSGVISTNFGAAAGATSFGPAESLPAGYSFVVVTAANEAVFRRVAPPVLLRTYELLQPGTPLRNQIDQVLRISQGNVDVDYILVDDRNGIGSNATIFAPQRVNNRTYVWPAAYVTRPGGPGARYQGRIGLGEVVGTNIVNTWRGFGLAWEGTLLHECLHTQIVGDDSGAGKTKWASIGITYGRDNTHYTDELLGDQPIPFEEGLGTFYGNLRNTPEGMNGLVYFFNRTDERYTVEIQSVLAGSRLLNAAPHSNGTAPNGTPVLAYRWRDVPGFYLLFCESTSTAFHAFFHRHVNNDPAQALNMINASASSMWAWRNRLQRYPTYAVNRLALQLEDFAATPQGAAARSAGTLTSSMFPFALLDILTHFGMTDDEYRLECERNNPDRTPLAFTEYWRHRQALRQRVRPYLEGPTINIERAVAEAHSYFQQANTILGGASPTP